MARFQLPRLVLALRRLFRFRLLTLFAVLTIISAWLAYRFHREPISPVNLTKIQQLSEIPRDVFKIAYSPDRRRVAFIAWEAPVDVRESVTLWPVRTIGENKKIIQFAFSPDTSCVAYCENTSRVEILRLASGQIQVLETDNPQPQQAFSPDGRLIATGGYGTTAKLWDLANGKLLQTLDVGPIPGGLSVLFSPSGRTIAVGHRNSNARLFDVATGQPLCTFPHAMTHEIAFHPFQPMLAIAYVDGSLRLCSTETGNVIAEQKTTAEEIYSLDWSPDGKLLASAGLKGDICLWTEQLGLARALPAPEWVISVKFSPDGSRLITAGGARTKGGPRSIKIWGVPPLAGSPFRR